MGDELKDRLTLLESDVLQLSRAIRTIAGTSSTGFEALGIRISEVESQLGRLSRLAAYIDLEKGAESDASESAKSVGEEINGRLEKFSEELRDGAKIDVRFHYAIEDGKAALAALFDADAVMDEDIESVEIPIGDDLRAELGKAMKANPAAKIREKIAANYVRFMETLVGPDLPEGVSPSAAVPNASHAITHREVVAWNAHQEKVTEGTLFFIQSEENRTPVYVVLPDGKEVLEYFDHARLTE